MSEKYSTRLYETIMKTLDYFRKEYNLTYAEVIGVIEIIKHTVILETYEEDDI